MDVLVRRSFYSHFTLKNFRDIELREVDRALDMLGRASSKSWKEQTATSLGEFFHADYAIYGKVLGYTKLFAGIYSQLALEVEVELVECKTGTRIWHKTVLQRSHEGGFPLTLFGVIPETVRSGLHMQKERTMDLIERVSREMADAMPDPSLPSLTPYFLDVQVGSFLEEGLALKLQHELQGKGYPARVESAVLGDRMWHRVLIGPYTEAAEAQGVKTSLAAEDRFKPLLIYHQAQNRDSTPSGPQ